MSAKELGMFIKKVSQLNKMVDSLEEVPGRKELLASCKNHTEVVELAKAWGFSIGRRWGEKNENESKIEKMR